MRFLTIAAIAAICHEANRRLCEEQGDDSQPEWFDAPRWQKDSAIAGVTAIANGTVSTPEQSHVSWMHQKLADGWTYGEKKDLVAKTHPCMMPYDKLPASQQAKNHLFRSIVVALLPFSSAASVIQPPQTDPRRVFASVDFGSKEEFQALDDDKRTDLIEQAVKDIREKLDKSFPKDAAVRAAL